MISRSPYDFKMWTANGQVEVILDYETFPALRLTSRLIGVQVECSGGVFVTYDQPTAGTCAPDFEWIESIEMRWTLMGMKVIRIGLHHVTLAELYKNEAKSMGRIKDV